MHRRAFLAAATASFVAGCGRRSTPVGTAEDAGRIAAALARREEHLRGLARFRVPPDAVRTSGPPPADVLAHPAVVESYLGGDRAVIGRSGAAPSSSAAATGSELA